MKYFEGNIFGFLVFTCCGNDDPCGIIGSDIMETKNRSGWAMRPIGLDFHKVFFCYINGVQVGILSFHKVFLCYIYGPEKRKEPNRSILVQFFSFFG